MIEPEIVNTFFGGDQISYLELCLQEAQIPTWYTLHFQEASYSLLMTLRLMVLIADSDFVNGLEDWYDLVKGEKEIISIENEKKVNEIVCKICIQTKDRLENAQSGLKNLLNTDDCQNDKRHIINLMNLSNQELDIVNSILTLP